KNGLFKLYGAYDQTQFKLMQDDIDIPEGISFQLKNKNFYSNMNYEGRLGERWRLFAGGGYAYSRTDIAPHQDQIVSEERSYHAKLKLSKRFNSRFKLHFGAEQFITDFTETYSSQAASTPFSLDAGFQNRLSAAYAEADLIFSRKLAVKGGLRGEYSQIFKEFTLAPRASIAYKVGSNSQFSLAYGNFYQLPDAEVLKFQPDELSSRKTEHYILNYLYSANNRILRAELYRKSYRDLITYDTDQIAGSTDFQNNGNGYAQGFDIFYRDNETIKNFEYWLSYSYLDSERLYRNFPRSATPNYANAHNVSVVGKYWVENWQSQIGASLAYASGRNYTDPNRPGFLQRQTKDYLNLSLNWAYLISPQQILYVSVNNAIGYKNMNVYQYASTPNSEGIFDRRTLRPAADQFFFVGFFWTISEKGTDNQLDNLN
ncbi:MAG: TonB-dependent receptor, partial [Flavobacteriaceae bacterium]|nr:TonB-dependent receptor [Flavobacteriaceae bacterium]